MIAHTESFRAPPSAFKYMLKAVRPYAGWSAARGFPDLRMIWHGYSIAPEALRRLHAISGAGDGRADPLLLLLLPQVTGFRLPMAMVTHPRWPLPIWRSLQVRNRLTLHQPLAVGETGDLITHVAGWRVLDKGIELDLQSWFRQGDDCVWESVVTFYYRGRFGPPSKHGAAPGAPRSSPDVDAGLAPVARWRIADGARWSFGKLTGDYNPVHQWDFYAQRMGFSAAFPHSQWVVAQCLGHLAAANSMPLQLDLWLKGPVYFGSDVITRQSVRDDGRQDFALWIAGEPRPPLVGSLSVPRQPDPAD